LPVLTPLGWPCWVLMVLPPGAFFTLGILIGAVNHIGDMRARRLKVRSAN